MTSYNSRINQLRNDIVRLQKEQSSTLKKVAEETAKSSRAQQALLKAKTTSAMTSSARDVERHTRALSTLRDKEGTIGKALAAKQKDLVRYEGLQAAEDTKTQKKMIAEQERLLRAQKDYSNSVSANVAAMRRSADAQEKVAVRYDFFISHASEDKAEFVADLARELSGLGAEVFYDSATLKIGDSLRRKIDEGLTNSRFGIVVLSEHFFKKSWPQRELDGLTAMEIEGHSRILPIWHKVTKDEVMRYSPSLADKVALNTAISGVKEIAAEIYSLL